MSFSSVIDSQNLNGINGFTLNDIGTNINRSSGMSVSNTGDINGDGLNDILREKLKATFPNGNPNQLLGGNRRFVRRSAASENL